jgi:hypothetical protein
MLEALMKAAPGTAVSPGAPGSAGEALAADALVLSFPLYVDGLPAPLLGWLETLCAGAARARAEDPDLPLPLLYAAVNTGFFEPAHCLPAAGALRLFCRSSGLGWGGALMAGGGPVMSAAPGPFRLGLYPFGRVRRALKAFALRISALEPAGVTLVSLPMPRRVYASMANSYWRLLAIKNGVPQKALYDPALGPERPEGPDTESGEAPPAAE